MTITHTGLGDPSIKSESHFSTTSLFQAKSEAIIGNYALGAELIGIIHIADSPDQVCLARNKDGSKDTKIMMGEYFRWENT